MDLRSQLKEVTEEYIYIDKLLSQEKEYAVQLLHILKTTLDIASKPLSILLNYDAARVGSGLNELQEFLYDLTEILRPQKDTAVYNSIAYDYQSMLYGQAVELLENFDAIKDTILARLDAEAQGKGAFIDPETLLRLRTDLAERADAVRGLEEEIGLYTTAFGRILERVGACRHGESALLAYYARPAGPSADAPAGDPKSNSADKSMPSEARAITADGLVDVLDIVFRLYDEEERRSTGAIDRLTAETNRMRVDFQMLSDKLTDTRLSSQVERSINRTARDAKRARDRSSVLDLSTSVEHPRDDAHSMLDDELITGRRVSAASAASGAPVPAPAGGQTVRDLAAQLQEAKGLLRQHQALAMEKDALLKRLQGENAALQEQILGLQGSLQSSTGTPNFLQARSVDTDARLQEALTESTLHLEAQMRKCELLEAENADLRASLQSLTASGAGLGAGSRAAPAQAQAYGALQQRISDALRKTERYAADVNTIVEQASLMTQIIDQLASE